MSTITTQDEVKVETRGRPKGSGKPLEERFPGMLAQMGTMPDTHIAKEHGVSAAYVCAERKRQGIPAFKRKGATAPTPKTVDTWQNKVLSQLLDEWSGTLIKLAEKVGCHPRSISTTASPSIELLIAVAEAVGRSLVFSGGMVSVRGKFKPTDSAVAVS